MITDLLGLLLTLALMLWILAKMVSTPSGYRPDGTRRYERRRNWSHALVWVPIGYSLTELLGSATPVGVLLLLCVGFAFVQRLIPRPTEIMIGGLATVVTLSAALEGSPCKPALGVLGITVLVTFAGFSLLTTFLTVHPIVRTAQTLSIATATIELILFALSPVGGNITDSYGPAALYLPAAAAGLAIFLAAYPKAVLSIVGGLLIAAEISLALHPAACDRSALPGLIGAVLFAGTRVLLSRREVRERVGVR